ncbi:hypothetical protein TWF970_006906 [Orbilia oligospora]|uniref:C2H2-type domain-containing protein n=1 Tax=Orbilia oligospora TaxID=2813651 RepID=A0A7C8VKU2_ORBOL|nr:hypothetical protein TWF970_006906 [Orbilia oligospora]
MEPLENYNQDEIYELTKACKGKFLHLLESAAPQEQTSCYEFIRKQYDSLGVWIATTGALAPSEASLDHRLRDHNHILLAIVELLFLIQDCLKDEPCTTESEDQVDENSQMKTKDREVKTIISQHGALDRALGCLHQLASSIRRASIPNSQFDLSARFFTSTKLYDPNFLDYMKRLLKYRFPSAAESLISQLATSMSRRQNLLRYKARHAQKLSQDRDHIVPSVLIGSNSTKDIETASAKHVTGAQRSIQTKTQLPATKTGLSFAYSNTEASRLPLSKVTPRWRASSSITSTRAGVGLCNDQGVYPSIPTFSKDEEFCICPYCFQTLGTNKLSQSYWRNHYDNDIKPFVCLSEACSDSLQFFSKFDSWKKHMVNQHSEDWPQAVHSIAWCCDIDDCQQGEKIFYQRKDFEEHLEVKPTRKFSANQITALAVRKEKTIRREVGTCPLCEVTIRGVSNLQNSPLADHIGGHLHYLASLCAPELNMFPDNADSESQPYRRKTMESSQTDSTGQLLTEIEREKPIFYDFEELSDRVSNAADTRYQSPELGGFSRTVDRYYFMVQNYDPAGDMVIQGFTRSKRLHQFYLITTGQEAEPDSDTGFEITNGTLTRSAGAKPGNGNSYSHPLLGCPFAKGKPGIYAHCSLLGYENLSGLKEHLRRVHFKQFLPRNIRHSKSWSEIFAHCNPKRQGPHPDPHVGVNMPQFLDPLDRLRNAIIADLTSQTQETPQSLYGDTGSPTGERRPAVSDEGELVTAGPKNIIESDPSIDQRTWAEILGSIYSEDSKLLGQSSGTFDIATHYIDHLIPDGSLRARRGEARKKRYSLISGLKNFTFNDFTEFRSGFEHWMKSEFVDPLFSWDEMVLITPLEGEPLRSLEEVVDSIEQILLCYRTSEVALYLLMKDDTLSLHDLAL